MENLKGFFFPVVARFNMTGKGTSFGNVVQLGTVRGCGGRLYEVRRRIHQNVSAPKMRASTRKIAVSYHWKTQ